MNRFKKDTALLLTKVDMMRMALEKMIAKDSNPITKDEINMAFKRNLLWLEDEE